MQDIGANFTARSFDPTADRIAVYILLQAFGKSLGQFRRPVNTTGFHRALDSGFKSVAGFHGTLKRMVLSEMIVKQEKSR
jgi:hypothetical protein